MSQWHEMHHLVLEQGLLGDMLKEVWTKIGFHRVLANLDRVPLCVWVVGQFPGHTHTGMATYWPPTEVILWEQRADMIIPVQFPSPDAPGGDGSDYQLIPNSVTSAARRDLIPLMNECVQRNELGRERWFRTLFQTIWELNTQAKRAFSNGHELHAVFERQTPRATEGLFLSPFWHAEYQRAQLLVADRPLLLVQIKVFDDSRNPYQLEDFREIVTRFLPEGWVVAFCGDTEVLELAEFRKEYDREQGVFWIERHSLARTWAWALVASIRATTISSMQSLFTILPTGNFIAYHPQLPEEWVKDVQRRFILTPQQEKSRSGACAPGKVGETLCEFVLSKSPENWEFRRDPYLTPGGCYLTATGVYRTWKEVFGGA